MYTNEEEKNKKKTEEQTGTQEQTAETQEQTTEATEVKPEEMTKAQVLAYYVNRMWDAEEAAKAAENADTTATTTPPPAETTTPNTQTTTDGATTPPVAPASTTQTTGETTPAQETTPETIATPTTTPTTTTTPPTTEGVNANGSKETATPPVTTESIAEGVAAQTAKEDAEYDAWLAQQTADMDSYLSKEDSIGNQVKEEAKEEHKDFDAFWQQKMAESDAAAKEAIEELDNAEKAELEKISEDLEKTSEWNSLDLENKRLDAITQQLTKARDEIKKKDEVAQKRGRSLNLIAGLSDGLAALANLVGVAKGGTHMDLGEGSLTPLTKKLEEARKERKGDIKSIDDRLDQISNQQLQLKLAKFGAEQAKANADLQHERALEQIDRKAANDLIVLGAKHANALEKQDVELEWKAGQNEINNAVKKDIALIRAGASGRGRTASMTEVRILNANGTGQTFQLPSSTARAIAKWEHTYVSRDIQNGDAATKRAYEEYEALIEAKTLGEAVTPAQEKMAWQKVLGASPSYRKAVSEAAAKASEAYSYAAGRGRTGREQDAAPGAGSGNEAQDILDRFSVNPQQ